jgi:hypothetical protein
VLDAQEVVDAVVEVGFWFCPGLSRDQRHKPLCR